MSKLKEVSQNSQDMYVTWGSNPKSKSAALVTSGKAINTSEGINRTIGAGSFRDIVPHLSIRESYGRSDYDTYRTHEAVPRHNVKDIISACDNAYRRIGIIRNVVDLMTDFTVKGIRVVHPIKSWEKVGKAWAKRIKLKDRSERMVSLLCRHAIGIVKRTTEKLKPSAIEKLKRGMSIAEVTTSQKNEIPTRYTFINPLATEITDDSLGDPIYWLRVNSSLSRKIFTGSQQLPEQQMLALLPPELKVAAKQQKLIKLDPDKTRVVHYKKDDWKLWGDPFIYAILDDLIVFEKLKLADITALDGAISHVRLWKLGDVKEKIMPTPAAVAKLADILANAGHGGTLDIIWDATLNLQETSSELHNFLGDAKYAPVLNNIYAGLGIPPTLTGSANASGFTNNFISLKTLTERLNYLRDILIDFWLYELELLQIALGATKPFGLEFDRMSLSDEASEKALLIQLADRNLISVENVQRMFGNDPDIENGRIRRDVKLRKSGKIPEQAGPFHKAEHEKELQKIALQKGMVTPGEIGMELEPRKPGEKSPMEMDFQVKKQQSKNKGIPQQGRPKNSKDATKRKQKKIVPRTSAIMWAADCQKKIDEFLTPVYLKECGKANLRQLTTDQAEMLEQLKFTILANIPKGSNVNEKIILETINQELIYPSRLFDLRNQSIGSFIEKFNRNPVLDEIRNIEANIVGLISENGVIKIKEGSIIHG